jgi:hypothetical protein
MSYSSLLKDLRDVPLSEMFILFALVSLALFPLVFLINRIVADSGFVFAFICLSMGVVLRIVQVGGWLPSFKHALFFENVKLMIFGALSLVLFYLGCRWLGIPGGVFFSFGIIGVMLLGPKIKKKPIFSEAEEDYSLGRKDMYYMGLLLLITLFSIRKLLTTEPIVFWDWSGFGLDALDNFFFWSTRSPNPYAFFAAPLILLIGNELASNVFLLAWIPIAGIAFYCFAARMIGNRPAGFVASFVYVFNPIVLDRFLSGHIGMLIGYATMPLILLLFVSALENQNFRTSFVFSSMAGVLLAFSGLLQWQFFYLHGLLITSFFISYSMLRISYRRLKKGILLLVLFFSMAAILSSPWLLPTLKLAESGYYSDIAKINYPLYLSTQTYLYNTFRLIGQTGVLFMEDVGYTSLSMWPLLGFVMVFFGFSTLLLHKNRKEKMVLIFSVVVLIGTFLSTGMMYLGLYGWLYQNIPFFVAFREPSKFLGLAGFGLSMMVGLATECVLSLKGVNVRSSKFIVPMRSTES